MIKFLLTFENGITVKAMMREKDYRRFLKETKIDEKTFVKKFKAFLKKKGLIK